MEGGREGEDFLSHVGTWGWAAHLSKGGGCWELAERTPGFRYVVVAGSSGARGVGNCLENNMGWSVVCG